MDHIQACGVLRVVGLGDLGFKGLGFKHLVFKDLGFIGFRV